MVSAIASTAGIRAATEDGAASLMLSALACNEEETTAGFGMDWARAVERLDVEAVATDAVDRAVELLGATSLPSRRTTVVFDPWVTSQFLGLIGALVSGGEVVRGRSLMAGRIGEQVASQAVSIVDDPTSLRWFGAARFDAEGLATRRNEVVSRGVLSGFLHDGYSARVAGEGVRSTGSAVRAGYRSTPTAAPQALSFAGGWGSPAGLIAGMEDGVLVREVQGLHSGVNPISGDFSTGIEGRVIRNGELCEPIREVTMASTLQAMLLHIRAVCTDQRSLPGEAAGCTIAVDDVMLSGRG